MTLTRLTFPPVRYAVMPRPVRFASTEPTFTPQELVLLDYAGNVDDPGGQPRSLDVIDLLGVIKQVGGDQPVGATQSAITGAFLGAPSQKRVARILPSLQEHQLIEPVTSGGTETSYRLTPVGLHYTTTEGRAAFEAKRPK